MRAAFTSAIVALALLVAGAVHASTAAAFDLQVEGGRTPIVFQRPNGNYVGVLGFDTRSAKTTGGTITTADITAGVTSSASAVANYYLGIDAGFNAANDGTKLQLVDSPLVVAGGSRYRNSLLVEWTGGNLMFNFVGKTRTLAARSTIAVEGDPLAPPAVPLPAAIWFLLAGIGGLAAMSRRRRSAS